MDGDRFDPKTAAKSLWDSLEPQNERVGKYRPLATSSGNKQYDSYYDQYGKQFDVDPNLLVAQGNQESSFKQNARSNKGAMGLGQIMPATAKRLGVSNPYDPAQSIMGQAKYMSQHLSEFKDIDKALAAYNAGEGAVRKFGGIPPYRETRDYVKKIRGHYNNLTAPPFDAKFLAKSLWDNEDDFNPQTEAKSLWDTAPTATVGVAETPDFADAPNDPRAIKPPFTLPPDTNIQPPPVDRTYPPQGINIPDDIRQNYNEYLQLTGQPDTPQAFAQYQKEAQGAYAASVKQFGQPQVQQQPQVDARPRLAPGIVTPLKPRVIKGGQQPTSKQPQSRAQVTFAPASEASNIRDRNLFAVTETKPSERIYKSAPTKEQFLKDAITDYYGSKAFEAEAAYRGMTGKELFPSARNLPDIAPYWNAKTGKVEGDLYHGGNVRELVNAYAEGGENGLRAELGMQNQRSSATMENAEEKAKNALKEQLRRETIESKGSILSAIMQSPISRLVDAYDEFKGTLPARLRSEIESETNDKLNSVLATYGSARNFQESQQQKGYLPGVSEAGTAITQAGKGAIVDNMAPLLQYGGILQSAFDRYVLGSDSEAKDTALYKSGKALQQTGEGFFGRTEGTIAPYAKAIGQVGGTLLTSFLGGNIAGAFGGNVQKFGTGLGMMQGIAQQGADAYETARSKGGTEDQSMLAALMSVPGGALEGASEYVVLGKLSKLQKLDALSEGAFSKGLRASLLNTGEKLKKIGGAALEQGAIEYLIEEVPQNLINNEAVKIAIQKDPVTFRSVIKDLDKTLVESLPALVAGGAVGGVVGAAETAAQQPTDEAPQPTKMSFYHQDFGQVVEDENQSGVPQGKIRVMDENGDPHVIQKPNKAGKGNQKAVIAETKASEAVQPETERPISPEELEKKIAEVEAKIPETKADESAITPQKREGKILPADEGVRLDTAAKISPEEIKKGTEAATPVKPVYIRKTTPKRAKEAIAGEFETTPAEISTKRGKEFDAETTRLLGQSKELEKITPIDDPALLDMPYAVTYKSASGKTLTRRMTVGKRQEALQKKEGVLEKLLGCVHG